MIGLVSLQVRNCISLDIHQNMPLELTTFEQAFDKWNWKEIRNCPGRFIFASGRSRLTCEEIIGIKIKIYKFKSEKVVDEILVTRFATGGGLVSYVKEDCQFLHTLNNEDGFTRKLQQLGIVLPNINNLILKRDVR